MTEHSEILNKVKSTLQPFLECIDHTVSRETFTLMLDDSTGLLTTTPKPKDENLDKYYESADYISHTDSKKSFLDKIYQLVKNYSIKQKLKLINSLDSETKSILDIGCGTGDFLEVCKKTGWDIKGIEPNDKARNLALKKLKDKDFLVNNINCLLESNHRSYDVITMWHVLEHIPDLEEQIVYLKKLLKKNGTLIIAVPNYKSHDAEHYGKYWAAYDVPRHLWHFSRKSLSLIFTEFGFKIVKTLPMIFDAYYVSLLSEKYRSGKSNPVRAFIRGFISNAKAKRTKEYSSLIYILKTDE